MTVFDSLSRSLISLWTSLASVWPSLAISDGLWQSVSLRARSSGLVVLPAVPARPVRRPKPTRASVWRLTLYTWRPEQRTEPPAGRSRRPALSPDTWAEKKSKA